MLLSGIASSLAQQQPITPSPAGTIVGYTIGTTSTTVLSGSTPVPNSLPPKTRKLLWLHNPSETSMIWCSFGVAAVAQAPGTIIIPPTTSWLWGAGSTLMVPGDSLNCVSDTASSPLTVEVF